MEPIIGLKGAPIMRYQGNQVMEATVQLMAYIYKNIALVAFTGAGNTFDNLSEFGSAKCVINYGTGFRYELVKEFGLYAGLDFEWSNSNEFAFFFTFGSAWNK